MTLVTCSQLMRQGQHKKNHTVSDMNFLLFRGTRIAFLQEGFRTTHVGGNNHLMASNFIHRMLKSLRGLSEPSSTIRPLIVDNEQDAPYSEPLKERRLDARFAVRTPCLYELGGNQHRAAPTISGKAHSLNVSSGGILLLLDQQPQTGQVLSLQNPAVQSQQRISLFEVRWTTSLPLGTQRGCHLVGCHLAFGSFPFFIVQRQYLHRDISSLSL